MEASTALVEGVEQYRGTGTHVACNRLWNSTEHMQDRGFQPGFAKELKQFPEDQKAQDLWSMEIEPGLSVRLWIEISNDEAIAAKTDGAMILSGFVVWSEGSDGRKGCFVVNFSKQSGH